MRETLYTKSLTVPALAVTARSTAATVNGPSVDLGAFGNDFRTALFVVVTGTITDGSHATKSQHSADGTTWVDVPAERLQGTAPAISAADDDKVFQFGYVTGSEQFVRLVVTTSGATTGGVFGAVAVLSEASSSPVVRA